MSNSYYNMNTYDVPEYEEHNHITYQNNRSNRMNRCNSERKRGRTLILGMNLIIPVIVLFISTVGIQVTVPFLQLLMEILFFSGTMRI